MRPSELLLREGAIDRATYDEVLESQTLYGGSFDTNLLETGGIDERTLQRYLERGHALHNRIDIWDEADPAAIKLLTPQQAEKVRAVPFRLQGGVIDLLVSDPTNSRVVDEVRAITGFRVQINVATEMRLAYHLYVAYGVVVPERMQALLGKRTWPKPEIERRRNSGAFAAVQPPGAASGLPAPAAVTSAAPVSVSVSFDSPVKIADTARMLGGKRTTGPRDTQPTPSGGVPDTLPPGGGVADTMRPGLAGGTADTVRPGAIAGSTADTVRPGALAGGTEERPAGGSHAARMAAGTLRGMESGRAYEGLAANLADVSDREGIPDLVLPYLAAILSRVVLFSVRKNRMHGWDARGRRLRREIVANLTFALDRPSVFAEVLSTGKSFAGPLPQEEVEEAFIIKLGGEEWPAAALVVPIRVKDRPVALLYGEAASDSALAAGSESADAVAELVAETFLRLLQKPA